MECLFPSFITIVIGFLFPVTLASLRIEMKVAYPMNCTKLLHLRYYSTNQRFLSFNHTSKVTKVDDALQVFDEMLQRQPPPSIFQFTKLITLIVNMKQYSTALILIKQMRLIGIPASIYTMNISINCHCRLNQVTYAFALLATIFKQSHPPDFTTYNTLLNGLVLADRVFEAVIQETA
ncbi:hypothetical protein L1987_75206 [Smallanthus sonchifolius]|uniref:Uncharacterized protein n=1 Tax=Smallanthus sonchifolius TaxID=185202 RepID=A0ACB9A4S7_9ASTR|nr:hypothetical protein L1987_75206 [Smallanthus sonchifolius]